MKADLAPAGQATVEGQDSREATVQTTQTFYQENFAPIYRFVYSKIGEVFHKNKVMMLRP